MTTCARKDCVNEGTHRPVLLFMPAAVGYTGPPAEMELDMLVCREHQEDVGASDLVLDEQWRAIRRAFGAAGRAEPDRQTIGLAWRHPGTPGSLFR